MAARCFVEEPQVVNDRAEAVIANTRDRAEGVRTGRELGQEAVAEKARIAVEAPTPEVGGRSADKEGMSAQVDTMAVDEIPPTKKVAKEERKLALASG
jgi:hypothetical protein